MLDALYVPPKPAIIRQRGPEIIRPGDPRFVVPQRDGIFRALGAGGAAAAASLAGRAAPVVTSLGAIATINATGNLTGVNISVGDCVVVGALSNTGGGSGTTAISDGANTYTKRVDFVPSGDGNQNWSIWICDSASSARSSATLSATASALSALCAVKISNLSATPRDSIANASNKGKNQGGVWTYPSTGVLSQSSEVIIGMLGQLSGNDCGNDATFTNLAKGDGGAGNSACLMQYKIVSATTSVQWTPTGTASIEAWVGSFKT